MTATERKMVTIYVDGTPHPWEKDEITYEQVVVLEFPDFAQNAGTTYSVKYTRGHGNKPEGMLNPGGKSAKVKDGMVFSVSKTGQS